MSVSSLLGLWLQSFTNWVSQRETCLLVLEARNPRSRRQSAGPLSLREGVHQDFSVWVWGDTIPHITVIGREIGSQNRISGWHSLIWQKLSLFCHFLHCCSGAWIESQFYSFIRKIQKKDKRVRKFRVLMREGTNVMNLEVKERSKQSQKVKKL